MYEGLCKTINLIFGRTIKPSSVIKIVTLIMSFFVSSGVSLQIFCAYTFPKNEKAERTLRIII
jgi:hypothetical protein